jgi:hypothetical protein
MSLTFTAYGTSSTTQPLTPHAGLCEGAACAAEIRLVNGALVALVNGATYTGTLPGVVTTTPDRSKQVSTLTHNGISVTITAIVAGIYRDGRNPSSNSRQSRRMIHPMSSRNMIN